MSDYVWRGLEYDGLERLRVEQGGMVRVASVIDSARGRYAYELTAERDWTFRRLQLEALAGERTLTIAFDGHDGWEVDGIERLDLSDAIDIDLAITPLTNTLPIRRLALEIDDEADITVAYVSFPDLEVTVQEQRYTRLDENLYRFESLDDDFTRDITVDLDGFVVDYPGLFERL